MFILFCFNHTSMLIVKRFVLLKCGCPINIHYNVDNDDDEMSHHHHHHCKLLQTITISLLSQFVAQTLQVSNPLTHSSSSIQLRTARPARTLGGGFLGSSGRFWMIMELLKDPGGLVPGGMMCTGIRPELSDDSSRIAGISFTRRFDLLILSCSCLEQWMVS